MTYMAPTMQITNVTDEDGFSKPSLVGMDVQDMYSNFDMSTFAGSEDFTFHGMHPSVSPGIRRMHSAFEDQFSDVVSAIETQTNHEAQEPEASIDRDNKLLSFSTPTFDHVLFDYAFRATTMSLTAQLHGMFFLAESPWASATDAAPPPSELTCYRRNLFQITGTITLPRGLRYMLAETGEQLPIVGQELTVSATESTEGNAVKIISVPWKTPANPALPAVEDKTEKEPPTIPIDLNSVQEVESEYAQYPFQWKRLQFRIATANNGRRKELQQHFLLRLKVLATLANGSKVPICEVRSSPVIVRGRSPRNFQSRKDTPLNGTASHARKSATSIPQAQRTASSENAAKVTQQNGAVAHRVDVNQPAPSVASFFDPSDFQNAQDFYDGLMATSMQHGAITAIPQEPISGDQHRGYAASTPDPPRLPKAPTPQTAAPINLSLVDEDTPKKPAPRVRDSVTPAKRPFMPPPRPPSFSINTVSTPDESADLLYEYFPLSLDEWHPPVDAVYRPHVVHHIKVSTDPRDPSAAAIKGRSKRYFSEAGV
ncbi:Transcription factor vib-1 [Sphaceloma murrayae]|uniref:Transcription factor vib-1 n=1 Tax=Sphaceloma murrayae TaxID=2082308 RepID=A0A2K1QKX2_9PEZI|nr:Transcription factor vib-1 [Sphaceloma murrayae]